MVLKLSRVYVSGLIQKGEWGSVRGKPVFAFLGLIAGVAAAVPLGMASLKIGSTINDAQVLSEELSKPMVLPIGETLSWAMYLASLIVVLFVAAFSAAWIMSWYMQPFASVGKMLLAALLLSQGLTYALMFAWLGIVLVPITIVFILSGVQVLRVALREPLPAEA